MAKSLSLMLLSISTIFTWGLVMPFFSVSYRAARSSGPSKGWPAASIMDTPLRGSNTSMSAAAWFHFSARRLPIAMFSSLEVRIRVTVGLCLYRLRCANSFGTVSQGPKLTISSAPTETTCGILLRMAASQRAGPAARTPPTTSSHHSVVVRSSTPEKKPASISASIVFPPVPVAWKTSTSYPFSSR